MKMKLRLFATDLDHTLLVNGKIPEENKKALEFLSQKGVNICFVSGRNAASVTYLANSLSFPVWCIATNGSIVKSPRGEILYEKILPQQALRELIRQTEERGYYYHFYDRDTFYATHLDLRRYRHLLVPTDTPQLGNFYSCGIYISEKWRTDTQGINALKFQCTIPEEDVRMEEQFRTIPEISVTRSHTELLEAMAKDVNKWAALEVLAGHLGIEAREICTCGDYYNDREMIQNAGIGIAMGNAPKDLRDEADYVTADCEEYGLAKAIWAFEAKKFW